MKKKTEDQKLADSLIRDGERLIDTLTVTKRDEAFRKALATFLERLRRFRDQMPA